jgi:dethiobiotin synthetase
MTGYFITGTDTGVGKTCVSLGLIHAFKSQGKIVTGMKPVSAGCTRTEHGLRNEDAVQLQHESFIEIPYDIINPYAYEPAVAPHIAAQELGEKIELDTMARCYKIIADQSEVVIVEGAGGWLAPINNSETMADLVTRLQLPVILVVGIRLGCLNHALISVESIKNCRLTLAGWVANQASTHMDKSQDNIEYLKHRIPAPLLGVIPHNTRITPMQTASCLDVTILKS